MVRDPRSETDEPELQVVLETLEDRACRTMISSMEEPVTANELSERCEIPLSTTYRKLDSMTDSTLIEELTEIRSDGRHTTRYRIGFEEVSLALDDDREFDLAIARPSRTADERLAYLWSEVKKEV